MRQLEKSLGRVPEGMSKQISRVVFPPEEMKFVWRTFCDLHSSRSAGMMANPISHTDILAWQTLYGTRLSAWEVDAIRSVDAAILQEIASDDERERRARAARTAGHRN